MIFQVLHSKWFCYLLLLCQNFIILRAFLGSELKNPLANAEDTGLILGSGRSLGEGNGNPLQYSCPENPMDRGAWWATVRRVTKSQTQLSN